MHNIPIRHISQFFRSVSSSAILLVIALIIGISSDAAAETVSQKQAKKIAEQFFNASRGIKMAAPKYVWNGKKLTTDRLFSPFYVYNHPSGGFVIISAENKTFPILGYDLSASFDPDNIGETTKALLSMYARHIEHIRYDSQIPYHAISAWQNIPQHISGMLSAPEVLTSSTITLENAASTIENISNDDDIASSLSATYFADQWKELINDEITSDRNIAIGLITQNEIRPAVIQARKGDFYRFALDGDNTSLFRLLPSEIITEGQIAALPYSSLTTTTSSIDNEEPPFTFIDSILAETRAEREAQQSAIKNATLITSPLVRHLGAGHYMITLPEEVSTVRIFSIDGATVFNTTYAQTATATINISHCPNGFYFAVLHSKSGKTYNVKLFR